MSMRLLFSHSRSCSTVCQCSFDCFRICFRCRSSSSRCRTCCCWLSKVSRLSRRSSSFCLTAQGMSESQFCIIQNMMIQHLGSKSSMNISSDSQAPQVDQYLNELNTHNLMQVRRPNEDQVLAFLDYEIDKKIEKPDYHLRTHPLSNKDSRSRSSKRSIESFRMEKYDDQSPLKQTSNQELLLVESPAIDNLELRKFNEETRKKSKATMSPQLSPSRYAKRKSRYFSRIFSKFTGKMHLAKRFINKLKQIRPFHSKLTSEANHMIQDLASDCVFQKPQININQSSVFRKFQKQFIFNKNKSIKLVPHYSMKERLSFSRILDLFMSLKEATINPQGNFLFCWEFCKIMITLGSLFQLSIQLCFSLNVLNWFFLQDTSQSQKAMLILLIYYTVDVIFAFKTGYYKEGEVVIDQARIAKRYLSRFFLADLVSILPIMVNIITLNYVDEDSTFLKALNCLQFVRSNAVSRIYTSLEGRLLSHPRFVVGYRFLSVIGMVFLYAHIFACLWYLVGMSTQNNWLVKASISEEPWYALYSFSIYWSVMTMTTVGYGDITPNNYVEALFCVFTMFIASIIFAYSLNTIGLILEEMNRNSQLINENMAVVNNFMRRKNLDPTLQFKVRQYLQTQWETERRFRTQDESRFISKLSVKLQDEIRVSLFEKFITDIPLIHKNFSQECMLDLAKVAEEHRISSNVYLFESNTRDSVALFMLLDGEAEVVVEMNERKFYFGKIKKGEIFGQSSFFYNRDHPYGVKVTKPSSFAILPKQSFLDALRQYPHDYFTYKQLIDGHLFHHDQIETGLKCQSCHKPEHDIDQCKQLHLILDRDTVIRRHQFSIPHHREHFKRNSRRTTNALFGQRLFEDAVSLYQENNYCEGDSQGEISESQEDIQEEPKPSFYEKTSHSHKQQTHTQKSVRFRKRSRSLNSLTVNSDEQEGSRFHKSMSGYKSQESHHTDKISAITPKNINGPSSQLSQSSFNVFLKESAQNPQLRKPSKQQESDKYSGHSNNQKAVQLQLSQQSSSGNLPQSSIGVYMSSGSPQVHYEERSLMGKPEDSLNVMQDRKRKSLIGSPMKPKKHKLQTVNETREQHQEDSLFSREASVRTKSNQQVQRTNKSKKEDSRTGQNRTETYRQFQDGSPHHISHSNSHSGNHGRQWLNYDLEFEIPCRDRGYFPHWNKDVVIEKFNNYQKKKSLVRLNGQLS